MVAIGSVVRIVAGGLHYYGSSISFLPVMYPASGPSRAPWVRAREKTSEG